MKRLIALLTRIHLFFARFYVEYGISQMFGLGVIVLWDDIEDHSLGIVGGPWHFSLRMARTR